MSQTILITGSSSGLGLAFLKHYASLPSTSHIIALDLNPLPISIETTTKISSHKIDIINQSELQTLAASLRNTPIDLLLHCAGIRGLVPAIAEQQRDVAAAETYTVMKPVIMLRTFEINTIGTFNVMTTFLPNLLVARDPKVIILSSRMGSVASNISGGGYAYRASKAALNAVVKSLSIDVSDVAFLLLHPGRVETGLVAWKEEGAISVEESLGDCLRVIEGLKREDSGKLVDRFGAEIPW
ncbi:C-factor [Paraphoma chrysanthemicola]|nr:C-factor [Paraphoma chrysanthemicola]